MGDNEVTEREGYHGCEVYNCATPQQDNFKYKKFL
jgi:hypothetical protein